MTLSRVAPHPAGSSLIPDPRRGASRAAYGAGRYLRRPVQEVQSPSPGARRSEIRCRTYSQVRRFEMRQLVLVVAGKPAAVVAALKALAAREARRA